MITPNDYSQIAKFVRYCEDIKNSKDFPEEVLERNVVPIGDGAHINIPKKHIGKQAKVFIYKND